MKSEATIILELVNKIADESTREAKHRLFETLIISEIGEWFVKMTCDPFKTYGIKPKALKTLAPPGKLEFSKANIGNFLNALIKRDLTGNAARDEVASIMTSLNQDGRELLFKVLSKDLKCGIGASTIQLVSPGLIPAFAVARAQTFARGMVKEWPRKGELKLDGQRNTFLCKDGEGAFFTRSGRHVPALDFFVGALLKAGATCAAESESLRKILIDDNGGLSFMLDGEAMMGLFSETGVFRRKGVDAVESEIHLYDMMSYADFDASGAVGDILDVRRKNLESFVRIAKENLDSREAEMINIVPQYFINSDDEAEKMFEMSRVKTLASYLARGDEDIEEELLKTTIDGATGKPKVMEGVMIKDPNSLYQKKKTRDWLKIKAEETLDLKIIGAYPGDPGTKYENCLGGIVLDHNGVRVRCGGGFSDEERIQIWEDWMNDYDDSSELFIVDRVNGKDTIIYLGDKSTYDDGSDFDFLGRLGEIEFNEVTPDGSLRHPRFVRFRDDKAGEISK